MKKFLTFKTFITPVFIKWYWYTSCIVSIIAGIQRIILGANSYGYSPFSTGFNRPDVYMVFSGIGIMIGGIFINRVICEVILSIVRQPEQDKVS